MLAFAALPPLFFSHFAIWSDMGSFRFGVATAASASASEGSSFSGASGSEGSSFVSSSAGRCGGDFEKDDDHDDFFTTGFGVAGVDEGVVVALAGVFGVVDFFAFGEDAEVEEEDAKRLDMPPRRLPVMFVAAEDGVDDDAAAREEGRG